MSAETVLKRLEDAQRLLEQARPRIPLTVDRLFNDYLAGYPTGGDPGGATLIDPDHPELGSVTLTQPERLAIAHDETRHARRQMTRAANEALRAAQTLADLTVLYGTYLLDGQRIDANDLERLYCQSCARVGVKVKREPHRRVCWWCDDWNRKANVLRSIHGKPQRKMPPVALLRKRFASKGRVSDRDLVAALRTEKRTRKQRKSAGGSDAPTVASGDSNTITT